MVKGRIQYHKGFTQFLSYQKCYEVGKIPEFSVEVTHSEQKMSVISFVSGDKYGMVEWKQLENSKSILKAKLEMQVLAAAVFVVAKHINSHWVGILESVDQFLISCSYSCKTHELQRNWGRHDSNNLIKTWNSN